MRCLVEAEDDAGLSWSNLLGPLKLALFLPS